MMHLLCGLLLNICLGFCSHVAAYIFYFILVLSFVCFVILNNHSCSAYPLLMESTPMVM